MNLRERSRNSSDSVAVNIITCFSCGVKRRISCTSRRIESCPSMWSHSSSTKCLTVERLSAFLLARSRMRPGVPTATCGGEVLSILICSLMLKPPKKTAVLIVGRYLENRSNSWQIWNASSRVWPITSACTSPSTGSSCCSTAMTNTAVLPMPALAWQSTSVPRIACGIHCCCTSDGCSKPQSTIACRSSGLSTRSRKPDEWRPEYVAFFFASASPAPAATAGSGRASSSSYAAISSSRSFSSAMLKEMR
eukprot:Amastigsp_a509855_89.p3 type:complete len:250 gc:universal Amastigsp_a509855_89:766-17(-)